MSDSPGALWINVSPSLRRFDQSLLNILSQNITIAEWRYSQTADQPSSLKVALDLLNKYMQQLNHPIHLLGHSTGGLLALLYTSCYPEKVLSLTLLSVGADPAVDWQAHYYLQSLLWYYYPRKIILNQTVNTLFGSVCPLMMRKYREILDEDLNSSLSPHSLYKRVSISPMEVPVPLFVSASKNDLIIDRNSLFGWKPYLKAEDCLWQCPSGRYFFHYFHPQEVSKQIESFWMSLGLFNYLSNNTNLHYK